MKKIFLKVLFIGFLLVGIGNLTSNVVTAEDELPGMTHNLDDKSCLITD